ncbi:MAG: tetratricopeptide (TPR) repeat protein [Gammaproteobacteria bacterium]|jgi:tetratricopeptide (TPR) repeat protein
MRYSSRVKVYAARILFVTVFHLPTYNCLSTLSPIAARCSSFGGHLASLTSSEPIGMNSNTIVRMFERCVRLGLIMSVVVVAGCGERDTPDSHFERATNALGAGDTSTAEIELKSALALDQTFVKGRWALGQLYFSEGKAESALKEFDAAAAHGMQSEELEIARTRALLALNQSAVVIDTLGQRNERSPTLSALLAFAYIKAGDLDKAESMAQQVLKEAPDNADAFTTIAEIALRREDYEKAVATADEALANNPNFSVALWAKGVALEKIGNITAATEVYRKLSTLAGQTENGKQALARMLLAGKQIKEAETLLRGMTDSGPTHYLRAGVAVSQGKFEEAKRQLQLSLKFSPNAPTTLLVMAMLNHREGDVNQAVAGYRRVLSLQPQRTVARRGLAALLVTERDIKAATKVLERGLEDNRGSASYVATLSGLLLASGDVAKAEQLLQNLPDGESNAEKLTKEGLLGEFLVRIGQTDKALDLFEEQARAYDVPGPLIRIVQTHLGRREFGKALEHAQELVAHSPKQAQSHWLLGTVYQYLDRSEDAKAAFTRALEIDPDHAPSLERLAREQLLNDPALGRQTLERIATAGKPGWVAAELNLAALDITEGKETEAVARYDALIDAVPNEPRPYLEKARVLARNKDLEGALRLLEAARKTSPNFAPVYPMLSRYYYFAKKYRQAVEMSRTALEAFPNDSVQLVVMARAHWALGESSEALGIYRTLVYAYPRVARPRIEFAGLLRSQGDLDGASSQIHTALEIEPRNPAAAFELAQIHLARGEFADAERLVTLLLAVEAKPELLDVAAEISAGQRKYGEATTHLVAALEQGPTSERANNLLIARANSGAMKDALDGAAAWLADHPDDLLVLFTRAHLHLANDNRDDARADYDNILNISPEHVGALNNLAWMVQETDSFAAVRAAARAYELAPENGAVADTYAWILAGRNELQQAQTILAKLMLSDNVPPSAMYHLAVIEGKLGQLDKAGELLDRVLALDVQFKEREAAEKLRERL